MKREYHRNNSKGKAWRIFKEALKYLSLLILAGFFVVLTAFVYYAKDLPRPEQFEESVFPETTKIYDRTGEHLLYKVHGEHQRTIVSLDAIPKHMQQAVVATEDSHFYEHKGIDTEGILRAIWKDIKLRELRYGGSTITQQLIRSTFFTNKKTIKRKVREVILALELERRHSKEQILEWYLNQVPFGNNAYGVEAAAQVYFNKPASELELQETATLAALIKAPSYLSPYGKNKEELLNRKDYVLNRMAQEHFITEEEAKEAKKKKIVFADPGHFIRAPHFVMYVLEHYLKPKYGSEFLEKEGLEIYTTLDWELQQTTQEAVKENTERVKKFDAHNGAAVAIKADTGEILAMVGSQNYFDEKQEGRVNVAVRPQQPGSAFKPFAYVTAFKKGYHPTTTIVDEKTNFGRWGGEDFIPQNYDKRFRGTVTLKQALAQSINVPSVKVLMYLAGIEDTIKTAHEMGIKSELPAVPSLVLGAGDVKLLNITSAYGTLANDGLRIPPTPVKRIENTRGEVVEENTPQGKRVLTERVAEMITNVLADNKARAPLFGENSIVSYDDRQVAVKTGTTNDYRDAWTIGYSDKAAVGVWVGNNDNSPMKKRLGMLFSSPMWRKVMDKSIERLN